MVLRQPGDPHGEVVHHRVPVVEDVLVRDHDALGVAGRAGCVLQEEKV